MQGTISNWQGQGGQQSIAPQKNWVWNDTFGGQTYSLDAMGNFVKLYDNGTVDQRTHNTSNEIITRLLGGVAKNPTFDPAGDMTFDGENYNLGYDFRHRLVQVKRQDDTLFVAFSYDALNRRIRKTTYAANGTTVLCDERFLYDGSRIIEKRDDATGVVMNRWVYGIQYVDEPIRVYRDSNLNGDFTDPNENFYFLQDRLFNVVALTDTDGQVQERMVYEPYGKSTCRRTSDGDETVASHFGNPYLFTGRELDSETGLYNYNHRYYSPALQRFINTDPISADINLYRYVGNNPVIYADPSGLAPPNEPGPPPNGCSDTGWIPVGPNRELPPNCPLSPGNQQQGGFAPPSIPTDPTQPPGPGWTWKPPGTKPGGPGGAWDKPGGGSLHPDFDHPGGKPGHWDWTDPYGNGWEYYPDTGTWKPKPNNKPNRPQPIFPPGTLKVVCVCTGVCVGGYIVYRCVRMIPSLFPPLWPTIIPNAACP